MGFLKKIIGQEPLMKTILGTFDLMTTNLNHLDNLSLKDISTVAQIQIILHSLNENAYRIELKTLEKSTILEGVTYPEISGDFTNYKLTDFQGSGEYLISLSANDLRIHSFQKNTTLRYVNLNFKTLANTPKKLKTFKERKKPKVKNKHIFSRSNSKRLLKLEEKLKAWMKEQPQLWNVYGDIYDTLTKNVTFDFETRWYKKFIEKYDDNIIDYILKGHTDKIKNIPKNDIRSFLHLQEKFAFKRLMEGSQDKSGRSLYDFIEKARQIEIEETFSPHLMQNKLLIEFSCQFDRFKDDEFEIIEQIEEFNENDGYLASEIIIEMNEELDFCYQKSDLKLSKMQSKMKITFKNLMRKANELNNAKARQKIIEFLHKNSEWIENYCE